jgi:hydroxymethylpyrimidine pyrophosphatase-like HAD family hydrolase
MLPAGLRKTMNLENLDVILASAGKESAVRFWMNEHGIAPANTVGIGDDVNDVDFLAATGEAHVLGSAYQQVLAEACNRGWNVCRHSYITGANAILTELLHRR